MEKNTSLSSPDPKININSGPSRTDRALIGNQIIPEKKELADSLEK